MGQKTANDTLSLDGDASAISARPAGRWPFLHPLPFYTEIYTRKVRVLADWLATGRRAQPNPDLPPFDHPEQMAAWWRRRKKHTVPHDLLRLAATAVVSPAVAAPAATTLPAPSPALGPSTSLPAAATTPPPPDLPTLPSAGADLPPTADEGYLAALQGSREAESLHRVLYNTLLRAATAPALPDDQRAARVSAAEQGRASWDSACETLRKMEKDAEQILTATGRTWISDEVLAVYEATYTAFRAGLERLPARLSLPPEQTAQFHTELANLFASLSAAKFTSAPEQARAA